MIFNIYKNLNLLLFIKEFFNKIIMEILKIFKTTNIKQKTINIKEFLKLFNDLKIMFNPKFSQIKIILIF